MTNPIPHPVPPSSLATADRELLMKDIHGKWDRFSADDMSALSSVDDLVKKVSSKYGFDQKNARIEVESVLKGRTF